MKEGFADLGGKLDTLIAKQDSSEQQRYEDRALNDARYHDHEDRLRAVEARKTIAPWQLWTAVSGGVLLVGSVVTTLATIFN